MTVFGLSCDVPGVAEKIMTITANRTRPTRRIPRLLILLCMENVPLAYAFADLAQGRNFEGGISVTLIKFVQAFCVEVAAAEREWFLKK
jgi:hypothetical protein